MELLLENIDGKLDLVLEGHVVLRADIERSRKESKQRDDHLLFSLQTLSQKIDRVGR